VGQAGCLQFYGEYAFLAKSMVFILLMISIIGLLVYVFYHYRLQQLIRLQKVSQTALLPIA
jgi:hypothetical protein